VEGVDPVSSLRSVVDELSSEDVSALPFEEVGADVAEISRAISRLTHQLQRRALAVAQRRDFVGAGFATATRWLAVTADLPDGRARRMLTDAETLSRLPETQRRFGSGEVSAWRTSLLAKAAGAHPEAYGRHEEMLIEFAEDLSHRDFPKAIRYWCHCADQDAAEEEAARRRERAYLHASPTLDGMVRIDALLDQEDGEAVLTALDAATSPPTAHDTRPAANRRAEALGDICRQWLANGTTTSGGVRPHVSVIVDYETLLGRLGTRCELTHTGTITPETARRILCDASVSRVVTDGESLPLDVGRAVRTATRAQRIALAVRDEGCRAPGCDRPPHWCDAHHIEHWVDGGPTDLTNQVLLCRHHHTQVHDGTFTIRIVDGIIQVESCRRGEVPRAGSVSRSRSPSTLPTRPP
jgi:hypothetical protein